MIRQAMQLREEKGFTLIELLIVIVILGVLAGIVVFAVGAFTDAGTREAACADKKSVEVAVEAYRAKNSGTVPAMTQLVPTYLRSAPSGVTISSTGAVTATGCS